MRFLAPVVAVAVATASCGATPRAPEPAPRPAAPLHTSPPSDLVAAAGLVWLIEAKPRALFGDLDLIPALSLLISEHRLDAFAKDHGGVDLRRVEELAIAHYPGAELAIARGPFAPGRVEQAFTARAAPLDGRAIDAPTTASGAPMTAVTRLFGTVDGERQQLALFGTDAVGLERGHLGPLRAAEAFAEGRLKRARPALHDDPLARAAELVGDAPLRAFAPGPFEGEWSTAFAGLLAATTAVGASLTPAGVGPGGHALVTAKLVLLGAWGDDAPRAAERVAAVFARLGDDLLGRLLGIDRPATAARVTSAPDAVTLEVTLDAELLARGLRDATSADVQEIMTPGGMGPLH